MRVAEGVLRGLVWSLGIVVLQVERQLSAALLVA